MSCKCFGLAWAALLVAASLLQAELIIETVKVRNPGNGADETTYGAVAYGYGIGKYEVTNAQYCEFLNAKLPNISDPESGTVLPSDTYGLYSRNMETIVQGGIDYDPAGPVGGKFSVKSGYANRPVVYVSWYDTVRFANWLTNGQGTGSTETGSYTITGGGQNSGTVTVPDASQRAAWFVGTQWHWLLPSEDEWYKSAYHKNDGVTNHFWDYPTGTDLVPSNDLLSPDPGNNANFYQGGYTTTSPYLTNVGEFENSESAYGTFDQGGNVWEWNEALIGSSRGLRGGGWGYDSNGLLASSRDSYYASIEYGTLGFRVASVPEPGSITLVICGAFAGWMWWRRWR